MPHVQHDVPLGTGAAGTLSDYLNLVMTRGLLRDDHNHGEFVYSDEDSALSFVGEDTWTALAGRIANCEQLAVILFMTTFGQNEFRASCWNAFGLVLSRPNPVGRSW